MSRDNVEFPDLGYHEPIKVSKGKLSIRQALLLIGKHQQDPTVNTPMRLANEFTLHPTVTSMKQYNLPFQLYILISTINYHFFSPYFSQHSQIF